MIMNLPRSVKLNTTVITISFPESHCSMVVQSLATPSHMDIAETGVIAPKPQNKFC